MQVAMLEPGIGVVGKPDWVTSGTRDRRR